MDTEPLISIITCFLNVEPYIQETIESVLQQDYTHWEMILIDDGSTDKSTNIAKRYAADYPDKIMYLEHDNHSNRGASISRNIGIQKSHGTLIAFLDADDTWLPVMLSELLTIMQKHPVALICEATEYWYSWRSDKPNQIIPLGAPQDRLFLPPELMVTLYPLGKGAAPCICGMLVKKEVLEKHGAFDNSFSGMYDDQSLLIKFYLHEAVYISSTCNNKYRQRPGSLVHTSHIEAKYAEERKYFLVWLKKYLQQNNIHYPEVNALLQKAWLPYRPFAPFVQGTFPTLLRRFLQKGYKLIKRGKNM